MTSWPLAGPISSRRDVEQGLRVVGYLLMHTRQLDMIMNDPSAVEHYRTKMRADIQSLAEN